MLSSKHTLGDSGKEKASFYHSLRGDTYIFIQENLHGNSKDVAVWWRSAVSFCPLLLLSHFSHFSHSALLVYCLMTVWASVPAETNDCTVSEIESACGSSQLGNTLIFQPKLNPNLCIRIMFASPFFYNQRRIWQREAEFAVREQRAGRAALNLTNEASAVPLAS